MISTAIGIIVTFFAVGMTVNFLMMMWQVMYGFDGELPWNSRSGLTVEAQKEHWWEYRY